MNKLNATQAAAKEAFEAAWSRRFQKPVELRMIEKDRWLIDGNGSIVGTRKLKSLAAKMDSESAMREAHDI